MVQTTTNPSPSRTDLSPTQDPNLRPILRKQRERQNRHGSFILWLTGLSGAGKSTIARSLEQRLFAQDYHLAVLDGDVLRTGLNADLGFAREDRRENVRRVGEVARLFMESGIITICALISPYAADRDHIRRRINNGRFVEIYVRCSLAECERRDTKGLYCKARAGLITGLTGIDDPFEEPIAPEIIVDSERQSVDQSVETILTYLRQRNYLSAEERLTQ